MSWSFDCTGKPEEIMEAVDYAIGHGTHMPASVAAFSKATMREVSMSGKVGDGVMRVQSHGHRPFEWPGNTERLEITRLGNLYKGT